MNSRDFILLVFAITLGVLIAGVIIAKVASAEVQSSLGANPILSLLSGLFGSKPATPATGS